MGKSAAFLLSFTAYTFAFSGATPAFAAPSMPLTYGGRLVGTDGSPLSGTIQLSATFHTAATAGTQLGAAPAVTVTLVDGVFSADFLLEDDELHAIFSAPSDPVWIEMKDEGTGKTWARQRFNAVPYALKVPVDDNTLNYDNEGRLKVAIAESGLDGELLASDGNGGFKWTGAGGGGGGEPAIAAGTAAQYWRGDKTWQTLNTTNVAEGTNLYYLGAVF